jgi:hypothetical protein
MAASTTTIGKRRAEREPAIKLRKGSPDAQFMDPKTARKATSPSGVLMAVATVEAPERRSAATTMTFSSAIVVKAPPSALRAIPPAEFDDQIEEPMDYSPLTTIAALDHPAEEWPEGSGPYGF